MIRKALRGIFIAVSISIIFQAAGAFAQEKAAMVPERRVVAWTNPILFVFGWYMAEAEIRLQKNHTVGISGSFVEFEDGSPGEDGYEDTEYFSINVFYRYYPTASFKGFFIGGQLGNAQVSQKENEEDSFGVPTGQVTDESGSAFSAGVLIGYGWVLGDAQRIASASGSAPTASLAATSTRTRTPRYR